MNQRLVSQFMLFSSQIINVGLRPSSDHISRSMLGIIVIIVMYFVKPIT